MTGILPWRFEVDDERNHRTFVDISGKEASNVLPALASETARCILVHLYDAPRTASDLAEYVDTSLQNVLYHLTSLQEVGLIHVVDTWYSSRGTEMKVYSPIYESVVLVAGSQRAVDVVEQASQTASAD